MAFLAQIGSTLLGAGGAMRQGEADANASRYNAETSRQNAEIARSQGVAQAEAQQREAARKIGAAVALYGASGVQVSTGSPMDVLADSVRMATLDKLTIRYNADLKARSYLRQSALDEARAENSIQAGELNATSAVLRGATSMASMSGGSTAIPSFGDPLDGFYRGTGTSGD
jgi:hypothetical protein